MNLACRSHQRLVRWTSLCVCFALVLTSLAILPLASVNAGARYRTARGSERVNHSVDTKASRASSPTVREDSATTRAQPGSGQGPAYKSADAFGWTTAGHCSKSR